MCYKGTGADLHRLCTQSALLLCKQASHIAVSDGVRKLLPTQGEDSTLSMLTSMLSLNYPGMQHQQPGSCGGKENTPAAPTPDSTRKAGGPKTAPATTHSSSTCQSGSIGGGGVPGASAVVAELQPAQLQQHNTAVRQAVWSDAVKVSKRRFGGSWSEHCTGGREGSMESCEHTQSWPCMSKLTSSGQVPASVTER